MRERLETFRDMVHKKRGAVGYDELTEPLPKFVDYAMWPHVWLNLDTPTDKSEAREFDVGALEGLVDWLATFDAQWIGYKQANLARLLKESVEFTRGGTGDGRSEEMTAKDLLSLAIAVFICSECGECMHSDDAIAHRCNRYCDWSIQELRSRAPYDLYSIEVNDMVGGKHHCHGTLFEVPDIIVTLLGTAMRACGMDPMTTTAEEMRAMNVRDGIRNASVPLDIAVLSEDADPHLIRLAVEAEQNALTKCEGELLEVHSKYWCCRLCDNKSRCLSHDEIVTHLAHQHDKSNLTDDQVRKLTFFHPDVKFVLAKSSIIQV
ncbi:hypothetical protein FOMPIDRAFT_1054635 [Fomitopsis schrenkii]|uniref:Uncharacterized protein n=1 Tax=Fomitopsis schrenkii TaxID=2126942 RepID=S8DNJ8_FOMSC|nr:hypothetical protein FOMPIDRAFT_1054635 [Fomitopsis schrenkii]